MKTAFLVILAQLALVPQTTLAAQQEPLTALPLQSASGDSVTARAEVAFAQLKQMVGTWRPADKPQSPLLIRFYLTAGDTVLVESWEARGQPHSLTLYHRDKDSLLATHYCPQGNQPRLALVGLDASGLHFAFRDATDLDLMNEAHQHDLWFNLTDPNLPVRSEVYASSDKPGEQEQLQLVRTRPTKND